MPLPLPLPLLFLLLLLLPLTLNNTPNLTYCSQIPYNPITSCNISCSTCTTRQQCSTCPPYLNLSNGNCQVPSQERMYYHQYFMGQNLKTDKNLLAFYTPRGVLGGDQVFRFCVAGLYRFDMIGLFSNDDEITFTEYYLLEASEIALNFRLFFATSLAIVKIEINSKAAYNQTIDTGFTLNYTVNSQRDSATNIVWNMGIIESNPSSYANTVWAPVRTGMLPLASNYARVRITVENGVIGVGQQSSKFWAISELSVVTRKCRTCVSETIKSLGKALGIVIGISFGIVILLLLILHIYSKIKSVNYRKTLKKRFHESQRNSLAPDNNYSHSQRQTLK